MFESQAQTSTAAKPKGRPYKQFTIPHKFTGLLWKGSPFDAPVPPAYVDPEDEDEHKQLEYAEALAQYEAGLAMHDPKDCWHDLQFRMVELSPREQDKASKLAGDSKPRLTRELLYAAIYQVGEWPKATNRSKLERWWRAIGPRAQRFVEAAFVAMNSVEEEDIKMFLDSAISGVG